MNVVIPAAGFGRRMLSIGPKALVSLGKETLLDRQDRLIREIAPEARICVVTGYAAAEFLLKGPENVLYCHNHRYAETNVARSILIGLRQFPSAEGVLIIYGDLVFSRSTLRLLSFKRSCALVDHHEDRRVEEVGVSVSSGRVTNFSFGLPLKWAQIVYLGPVERQIFQEIAEKKHRERRFGFEILNEVIDHGGVIHACMGDFDLAEIDQSRDIKAALQIQ